MTKEPTYRNSLRSIGVSEQVLEDTDDQYRALGRFHYHFSRVIFSAWVTVATAGTKWWPNHRAVEVKRALLEKTARPAMRDWFDFCRLVYQHNEVEMQISKWFADEFEKYVDIRNLVSHGFIWIGYGGEGSAEQHYEKLDRFDVSATFEQLKSVESMDNLTDELWYFRRRFSEYSLLTFKPETPNYKRAGSVARNLILRHDRVERVQNLSLKADLLTGG